ncbi:CoA-transferase family III domain-containing protein [Biscogniauxia mediterranea]|nr:CoA-transferase family III domain-containing protein [Biscogniauxia mediterranea]
MALQDLAPGATARLGLSYEELKDKYPSLIICGYIGSDAGTLSISGTKAEAAQVAIPIADIASAIYAYSGILAVLIKRSKTGRGSRLDSSMPEAMTEWMGFLPYFTHTTDNRRPNQRGPSTCQYIRMGRSTQVEVVLEKPDLATDAQFVNNSSRSENRAELKKIICDAFAALPVEVETPCGLVPALFPPGIGRASGVRMDEVPEVAQHNESILAELGM